MENTSNKTDYQKTLNLPQTDFAMKAGLVQKEPQMLARWQKDEIYQRIRQKAKGPRLLFCTTGRRMPMAISISATRLIRSSRT